MSMRSSVMRDAARRCRARRRRPVRRVCHSDHLSDSGLPSASRVGETPGGTGCRRRRAARSEASRRSSAASSRADEQAEARAAWLPVKNGSKIRSTLPAATPGPRSATSRNGRAAGSSTPQRAARRADRPAVALAVLHRVLAQVPDDLVQLRGIDLTSTSRAVATTATAPRSSSHGLRRTRRGNPRATARAAGARAASARGATARSTFSMIWLTRSRVAADDLGEALVVRADSAAIRRAVGRHGSWRRPDCGSRARCWR